MSALVFDTETNGLPLYNQRSHDPAQPHLVQIALLLLDDDGTELQSAVKIIRPDGWVISPEMTAIHGISQERAMDEGVPEKQAAIMFISAQAQAHIRVAHNASFDTRIMRIAMTRAGIARDFIELVEARPHYCTCNGAKPIVNLPPSPKMLAAGMKFSKSPKLSECYFYFFGEELIGSHDALVDARACARVYRALTQQTTGAAA